MRLSTYLWRLPGPPLGVLDGLVHLLHEALALLVIEELLEVLHKNVRGLAVKPRESLAVERKPLLHVILYPPRGVFHPKQPNDVFEDTVVTAGRHGRRQ